MITAQTEVAIRQQLSDGHYPWGIEELKELEGCESIIQACLQQVPALRPPAAFVAQQLLGVYTQHCISPELSISGSPSRDSEELQGIKARCWELIQQARKSKGDETGRGKLSSTDFQALLVSTRKEFDPITSFLVGAGIWWQVSEFDEWDDDLVEAYDVDSKGLSFSLTMFFDFISDTIKVSEPAGPFHI
jgi:hypothetical protein